ncbi:MAG: hypothetical protein JWO13_2905 [Acidobacteriales bacterium]|nr:hypothetical protein [Terriglobales bacterium]
MRVRLALACALFCALASPLAASHDPNSPSSDTFAALVNSLQHLKKADLPGLMRRAQENDPRSQMLLAIAYRDGIIVAADQQVYLDFLKASANADYAAAQAELGSYFEASGDHEQALQWLSKATAQGQVDAEFALGMMYAKGQTTPEHRPDMTKAVPLFLKAASQGHRESQYVVAIAYHDGGGVERDEAACKKWMLASAEQGYSKAQFSVAARYYLAKDYNNALAWFLRSAEQKHSRAELNVASMYFVGQGAEKNFEKALYWYQRAAEHGESSALRMIGSMYFSGTGVHKDVVASYAYAQAASQSGNQDATRELDKLGANLSQEQIAEASRRVPQLLIKTAGLETAGTIRESRP